MSLGFWDGTVFFILYLRFVPLLFNTLTYINQTRQINTQQGVISLFRHGVSEICAVLGLDAA
jgi:hypothetical protein